MFGFTRKTLVHRDAATTLFLEHCRSEASKLLASLASPLRTYCDGREGRPKLEEVMARPLLSFDAEEGRSPCRKRLPIEAHCYAISTVIGLASIPGHIDPSCQNSVMTWQVNELIVAEDVGRENVGHAPSPWPTPGMHVSYAPGTFVHGVHSRQQKLMRRYERLTSSPEKAVMLLMSLKVICTCEGIAKVVYRETDLGNGVVGFNRVGTVQPEPHEVDQWDDRLEITDADAALAELDTKTCKFIIAAISSVDPFWPTYSKSHRLTW